MTMIIGSGMAGLLAARMLAHRRPTVIEEQPSLPNNHASVLRFRSSIVGDVLGIPFRKVTMIKDTIEWTNPIADAMAYSFKNTGTYRSDRSVIAGRVAGERFIAPPDLIERMAEGAHIIFGSSFDFQSKGDPIISTIPMPALARALRYPKDLGFAYSEGCVIRATVKHCDAFLSVLVPRPSAPFSRISITGNELIIEFPRIAAHALAGTNGILGEACALVGIEVRDLENVEGPIAQRYSKIVPVDDDERKAFMFWATDNHNVFSLGRFATWRPGLLLDDLVNDVRLIDRWITQKDRYALAKHRRS